jgi:hypothetical protein
MPPPSLRVLFLETNSLFWGHRGEQIVLRVSDQVGPRATTHMHSDQSEAVWLVEFDQLSASLDRQSGNHLTAPVFQRILVTT